VGTIVRGIEGPPGLDEPLVAVRSPEPRDKELPLPHGAIRLHHLLGRALLGRGLEELLADKALQQLCIVLLDAEDATPQPELVPAIRMGRRKQITTLATGQFW
jgi:hypothetical protein